MAAKKAEEGASPVVESAELVRGPIDIAHLVRPFPPEAISTRKGGGGKDFSYLDFSAVVNRLNDATRYQWSFRILREEFVGDVLMVTGELTIPTLGTRAAVGVQKYAQNSGEDLLKGGASDCLKKCASLFGVGLFTCDDRYEEHTQQQAPAPQTQPATAAPPAPSAGASTGAPGSIPATMSAIHVEGQKKNLNHEEIHILAVALARKANVPINSMNDMAYQPLCGFLALLKRKTAGELAAMLVDARAELADTAKPPESADDPNGDPFAGTPDAAPKLKK